jgi:hypothetical protein
MTMNNLFMIDLSALSVSRRLVSNAAAGDGFAIYQMIL